MSIDSIYEPVQDGLKLVERKLTGLALVDRPWVAEPLEYVLGGSGKRIRPVLTLLAGRSYTYDLDKLVPMAAAIELFHNATLVHDDAVDKAMTRRGRTAVNRMWGEEIAVLLGDYLFSVAADLVCSIGSFRVMRMFAQTLTEISGGQLRETFNAYNWRRDRTAYYEQIYSKTASLFEAATGTGSILSGTPENEIEVLMSYGRDLGMAFQVIDDILDFSGDAGEMGKPVGGDLMQGTLTLPAIIYMEQNPGDSLIREIFEKRGDREKVDRVIEMVRDSTILDECYRIAVDYCDKARRNLEILPDAPPRQSLLDLAGYVVERRK